MFSIPIQGRVSLKMVYSCVCGLPLLFLFILNILMLLVNYEEINFVKLFNWEDITSAF